MDSESEANVVIPMPAALAALRKNWGWLLALGIIMIVLGIGAIGLPLLAGEVATIVVGWILVFGGVTQLIQAFSSHAGGSRALSIISGVIYLVVGVLFLIRPVRGLITLTLLLAIFFIVEGIIKIVMAGHLRKAGNSGWLIFNGIIALILGVLIFILWPKDSTWAPGLLVGVYLIVGGWSSIMVASAARAAARPEGDASAAIEPTGDATAATEPTDDASATPPGEGESA